jgi:hypothetical protein
LKTNEIASLSIAVIGTVIAVISLIYSVQIGQRSNRISNQSTKLASEQETIKRALKYEVVHRLISIYQNIKDFNDYLWLVERDHHEISSDFVADFYLKKATDLSDIRSTGNYFEYIKALRTFKPDYVITSTDISELMQSTVVSDITKKSLEEAFVNSSVSDALVELEANIWFSLFDTAQKIKYKWAVDDGGDGSEAKSHLFEGRGTAEKQEILYILRRALFFMERVEFLLAVLRKYEPEITAHIYEAYKIPDIN